MSKQVNIIAHQIALDVNNKQASLLRQHCGADRVAYNYALKDWIGLGKPVRGQVDKTLRPRFNAVKYEEYPWLKEGISSIATKNAIVNLGVGIKNWNDSKTGKRKGKKMGLPRPKSIKRNGYKYQADNGVGTVEVAGKHVKLPVIGWLRMREEPRFSGVVRKAFIKFKGNRWFITLTFERPADHASVKTGEVIGIDVGLKSLAVLSDGTKHEAPKPLKALLSKLRQINKELSRRVKGSRRRERTVAKLRKLHYEIACIRLDFLHKVSAEIANRPGLCEVRIETLCILGMRNKRLARAFADAGIAEFLRQIEYKCRWLGVTVKKASRWYPSSKLCHVCGEKNDTLMLEQREWTCNHCGTELDRDENASINLRDCPDEFLAARSAVAGRGDSVRPEVLGDRLRSVNLTDNHALH